MSSALYVNNIYKTADLFEKIAKSTSDEVRKQRNSRITSVGHFALDLIGLIPGAGEFADAANALWYAEEGQYLMAGLSLISVIPEIGDLIGKSGKIAIYLKEAGNTGKFLLGAGKILITVATFIKNHKNKIKMVLDKARENEKIGKYIDQIDKAIENFVHDVLFKADEDDIEAEKDSPAPDIEVDFEE